MKNPIRNERGILTLDFIFALIVGMSFTMIFFALTLTLSLVEVAQYISYSVARTALAAHEDRSAEQANALAKYAELRARPIFASVFTNHSWFKLSATPDFGDPANGFNLEYNVDPNDDNAIFWGARIQIEAKILNITIPMLGDSKTKPETGIANVQTFLGREVSTQECREQFNRLRWDVIKTLNPIYGMVPGPAAAAVSLITDNGC